MPKKKKDDEYWDRVIRRTAIAAGPVGDAGASAMREGDAALMRKAKKAKAKAADPGSVVREGDVSLMRKAKKAKATDRSVVREGDVSAVKRAGAAYRSDGGKRRKKTK